MKSRATTYLSVRRCINDKAFLMPAGKLLSETRITYIKTLWVSNPGLSAYELAKRAGLKDKKALYQFLQTHLGYGPKEMRKEIQSILQVQSEQN